ncbi:hypothetical protein V7S79_05560 [Aquirufa sp. ROCK-SH2]
MPQNLTTKIHLEDTLRENQFLRFHKIPWIFRTLIPTQLEVDGVKWPLHLEVDVSSIAKKYGHYRLRLVFFGFIKSKTLIITANQSTTLLTFGYQFKKWVYVLLAYSAFAYLLFSKNSSLTILVIKICLFILFILIELLKNFVRIRGDELGNR